MFARLGIDHLSFLKDGGSYRAVALLRRHVGKAAMQMHTVVPSDGFEHPLACHIDVLKAIWRVAGPVFAGTKPSFDMGVAIRYTKTTMGGRDVQCSQLGLEYQEILDNYRKHTNLHIITFEYEVTVMQNTSERTTVAKDASGSEYIREKSGNFERIIKVNHPSDGYKPSVGTVLLTVVAATVAALFGLG